MRPRIVLISIGIAVCVLATSRVAQAGEISGGSAILQVSHLAYFDDWLGEGPLRLTRIWAKSSGDTAADFHAGVDGRGRTLTVMSLTNGQIIGGYNPTSFTSTRGYVQSPNSDAFLFNLVSGTQYPSTRYTQYEVYNDISYGPTFGGGHDLYVDNSLSGGYSHIGYTYGDPSRFGSSSYRAEFAGSYSYSVDGLEVFTIEVVPEPATLTMLAMGFLALLSRRLK
jgi:hypothetical protein